MVCAMHRKVCMWVPIFFFSWPAILFHLIKYVEKLRKIRSVSQLKLSSLQMVKWRIHTQFVSCWGKKNRNEFLDKKITVCHARTLNFMNFSANPAKGELRLYWFWTYGISQIKWTKKKCPKRDMLDRRCNGNCQLNCCNNLWSWANCYSFLL